MSATITADDPGLRDRQPGPGVERPSALSWQTGYDAGGGELRIRGWVWRDDLAPAGPSTAEVTLSYDWSRVPGTVRAYLRFPPHHLEQSLAGLVPASSAARRCEVRG